MLGGGPYQGAGAKGQQFVQPTIFTGVSNDMRIAQEGVFGPVLPIVPLIPKTTRYRLAMTLYMVLPLVYGLILAGHYVCQNVKAGTVWVNTYRAVSFTSPFGGYKRSGEGAKVVRKRLKNFCRSNRLDCPANIRG